MITESEIEISVDRAGAGDFMFKADPKAVEEQFGVRIGAAAAATKAAYVLEAAALLAFVLLSFPIFSWFGILSIPGAIFLYTRGVKWNFRGEHGFSVRVIIAFAIGVLIAARGGLQVAWGVAGMVVGLSQILRYRIPVEAVRKAALRSSELRKVLAEAGVIVIRRVS